MLAKAIKNIAISALGICWAGLNMFIGVAALLGTLYACYSLATAQEDLFTDIASIIGCGCAALFVIITLVDLNGPRHEKFRWLDDLKQWFPGHTLGIISRPAGWFIAWAAIPCIAAIALSYVPFVAVAPDGAVAVLDDGRVLSVGQTAPADRYGAIAFIPLSQQFDTSIPVTRSHGYQIVVEVEGTVALADNPMLARFLSTQRQSLFVESDSLAASAQQQFFSWHLARLLSPMAHETVADIEQGKISGSPTATLIDLGTRVRNGKSSLPPWLGYIRVQTVSVPYLELMK